MKKILSLFAIALILSSPFCFLAPGARALSFDFSINVSGETTKYVKAGAGTYWDFRVLLISGTSHLVTLAILGLPTGATSFSYTPQAYPTFDAEFTITAAETTPAGTYPLTIKGDGGGISRTASVTLVVQSGVLDGRINSLTVSPSTACPRAE